MSWKVRHEGSPQHVEVPGVPQIVDGLQSGLWEPTDEVMAPDATDWVAIEEQPQLAEAAADVEPPLPPHHGDETHLDMNALIDVCLVLLIFFILTTSYSLMQKILDSPKMTPDGNKPVPQVAQAQVDESMITVDVKLKNGASVFRVLDREVAPEDLRPMLEQIVRTNHRFQLLVDYDDDVPHGDVVRVYDAAKGAKIEKIHLLRKK